MMSLFSSFDLGLFIFNWIFLVFLLIFTCFSFRKFFMMEFLNGFIFIFLNSSFKSLKSFKFKSLDSLLFSTGIILFFLNFISLFSYFFSYTVLMSLNFYLSLTFWLSIMMFSFFNNFKGSLSHLIPEGTPLLLVCFLFIIELVSSIIRPLTLMIRLMANIMSGHLLMILLFKLVVLFAPVGIFFVMLNLIEFFVSMIQSYIFITLICLYFSETK